MNLILIVAISENNVIGKDSKMPWHIPEDLKRFRELTLNHPIIMGRKTFESIGKPLDKRKNIILSRTLESVPKIYIARTIEEALELTENKDSYIIGGETIYKTFLLKANRLELTRINKQYEGDSFFPEIDWGQWYLINEECKGPYSFLSYKKI